MYLVSMLHDLVGGHPNESADPILAKAKIWCDNQGALRLMKQPNQTQKLPKHVDIRFLFTREALAQNKNIELQYLDTERMLADILTKPLPAPRFEALRSFILTA